MPDEKELERERRRDLQRTIPLLIGLAVMMVALSGLIYVFTEYAKFDRIYEKAKKDFVVLTPEPMEGQGDGADVAGEQEMPWYELAGVDLGALQLAYPDVVGWIFFENEDISYPIVYSGDNETYLRTAYTGERATAGSIFLDGESTPDFSDPHTLVYGHNMKNLSMFGRLRYYRTEEDYYEEHRYFQIFTGRSIYRYEVFAYGEISAYSGIYDVYGAQPQTESFRMLMNELGRMTPSEADVEVGASDHILTLSTCTGDDDTRMIVSAVRVEEHTTDWKKATEKKK